MLTWLLLFACTGSFAATSKQTLPAGVWRTQGYGSVFQVEPGRITLYDVLGAQCLPQSRMTPAQFSGGYGDWARNSPDAGSPWHLMVSGMTVEPLSQLPPACANASQKPDRDPLRNFDYLWQTFDTHYAFFAAHGVNWDAVREKYRPRVAALPKDGDPFPIFADMLALLADTHVRLSDGKRIAHVKKFPVATQVGPHGPVLLDDHYLQPALVAYLKGPGSPLANPAKGTGNGVVWYGRLKPKDASRQADASYGYVAIFSMDRFGKGENEAIPLDTRVQSANAALDEVVGALAGVKGIVVDLRYNGGGEDAIALAIAGHFTKVPRPAWSKRAYEKNQTHPAFYMKVQPNSGRTLPVPIAVLTSDFTVSAAETATMALRALPSTIQIGQPTRGVLSDRLEKILPNGWTLSLSNEIYMNPRGTVFEVNGVPPDIVTKFPASTAPDEQRFGRDIFIAIDKLDQLPPAQ
ncbi:S41 family peptidase [Dyella tabacisoli]|uniref:S41 family peptidase n=1 Tax=Dyella tabacisoli TaxID=2282381 RepID=UPI001CDB6C8D|nr:S41 family peptidase [Dyella tabacisoli]